MRIKNVYVGWATVSETELILRYGGRLNDVQKAVSPHITPLCHHCARSYGTLNEPHSTIFGPFTQHAKYMYQVLDWAFCPYVEYSMAFVIMLRSFSTHTHTATHNFAIQTISLKLTCRIYVCQNKDANSVGKILLLLLLAGKYFSLSHSSCLFFGDDKCHTMPCMWYLIVPANAVCCTT